MLLQIKQKICEHICRMITDHGEVLVIRHDCEPSRGPVPQMTPGLELTPSEAKGFLQNFMQSITHALRPRIREHADLQDNELLLFLITLPAVYTL